MGTKIGYSVKTSSTYGLIGHFQEEIMFPPPAQ